MHSRRMEIEFDPEKAASNLRKHRVSFAHAEQALRDPLGITIEDPDSEGAARFITLGADSLGRILVVVHTLRDVRVRIISARKASRNEARNYHA
ncbi:MAG: BrnT family toxin [Wenzhouxiangella sp.]|nr:BrnT family toxin [Wenzhouxiangella sp.]